jgi:hypothetical protein
MVVLNYTKGKKMRQILRPFLLLCLIFGGQLGLAQTGGTVTDLVFFADTVHPKVGMGGQWSWANSAGRDAVVKKNGTHSFKYNFSYGQNAWIWWRGLALQQDPSWNGPDTSVFYPTSTTRLKVWVKSTVPPGNVYWNLDDGFGGRWTIIGEQTVTDTNWTFIDLPVPTETVGRPMKGLFLWSATQTYWVDDVTLTNVRLYAGLVRTNDMTKIAASQVGYLPFAKKQFSSPAAFTSFEIKRVSDNQVVFTGGAPFKTMTSSVIGGFTVWMGDFTALTTPGRYQIFTYGGENSSSYPFDIGTTIYNAATRDALRYFYYQRAGGSVVAPHNEGPWTRPSNASLLGTMKKGWHDAGDLTIYNATMAQTIYWLLQSWYDFHPTEDNLNLPESGNGVPDILDEVRWGLEWFLSMQAPSGGFYGITCAVYNHPSYGYDHPNNVVYNKIATATTQYSYRAASSLAYAYKALLPYWPAFAESCLAAARAGFTWADANPGQTDDSQCNNYPTSGTTERKTMRMHAAAALLHATGESQYETAFQQSFEMPYWISSFGFAPGYASRVYTTITVGANSTTQTNLRNQFRVLADGAIGDANNHPFQTATHYYWGMLNNTMHRSGEFCWAAYRLDTTRTQYRDQLLYNLDYVFGRNYMNFAYPTGADRYGATNYRKYGFHLWMKYINRNNPNSTPFFFPGSISAGPNEAPPWSDSSYPLNDPPVYGYWGDPRPGMQRSGSTPLDGRFTDNDSWSTNEITISWNAVYLYNLYAARSLSGAPVVLPPSGTFSATPDTLPAGGGSVTLSWTSSNATSASIDQGIGSVALSGSVNTNVTTTTTYTLSLTNANGTTSYVARVVVRAGSQVQDITAQGSPLALITTPTGNGNPDIEVIRDGVNPPIGSTNIMDQFATYDGAAIRPFDWIGYQFSSPQTFSRLVFQEGIEFPFGGWFASLRVQVRNGGQWTDVQNLVSTPTYPGANAVNFETFELSFTPASGDAIRIAGAPGGSTPFITVGELRVLNNGATTVGPPNGLPRDYALDQNYPNPFNPATKITFHLPVNAGVTLTVYNLLGQEVATLANGPMSAGSHTVDFFGNELSNGVYLYALRAGDFSEVRKMILLK